MHEQEEEEKLSMNGRMDRKWNFKEQTVSLLSLIEFGTFKLTNPFFIDISFAYVMFMHLRRLIFPTKFKIKKVKLKDRRDRSKIPREAKLYP